MIPHLALSCSLVFASLVSFDSTEPTQLEKLLAYELESQVPSSRPAKSLETQLPETERVRQMTNRIEEELELVLKIPDTPQIDVFEAVNEAVREHVDKEMAEQGFSVRFEGENPYLVIEREALFIRFPEWEIRDTIAQRVMDEITVYERTAQPGELVEEFVNPNFIFGARQHFDGSQEHPPRPPLAAGQTLILRRCPSGRGSLSEKDCQVALYRAFPSTDFSDTQLLVSVWIDSVNPRAESSIARPVALTGVWAVKQFMNYALLYHINVRYRAGESVTGEKKEMFNASFRQKHEKLLQRLEHMVGVFVQHETKL